MLEQGSANLTGVHSQELTIKITCFPRKRFHLFLISQRKTARHRAAKRSENFLKKRKVYSQNCWTRRPSWSWPKRARGRPLRRIKYWEESFLNCIWIDLLRDKLLRYQIFKTLFNLVDVPKLWEIDNFKLFFSNREKWIHILKLLFWL